VDGEKEVPIDTKVSRNSLRVPEVVHFAVIATALHYPVDVSDLNGRWPNIDDIERDVDAQWAFVGSVNVRIDRHVRKLNSRPVEGFKLRGLGVVGFLSGV